MRDPHDAYADYANPAEELLDHGRRFWQMPPHTCRCDGCLAYREEMIKALKPDVLEICKEWAKAPAGLVFEGLVEDWKLPDIVGVLHPTVKV